MSSADSRPEALPLASARSDLGERPSGPCRWPALSLTWVGVPRCASGTSISAARSARLSGGSVFILCLRAAEPGPPNPGAKGHFELDGKSRCGAPMHRLALLGAWDAPLPLLIPCPSGSQVFLKSDSLCLMEGRRLRAQPTLPSAHLLAMHIQQLETGGFTMTNGAHRWSKLR